MDNPSSSANPPAKSLINALQELEKLCLTLQEKLKGEQADENISGNNLKLIAEYRQLLKLRFEMLRKARTLIDEASFQCAVLNALNEASEDVYKTAIAKLCDLEQKWHGDDEPFDDDDETGPDEEGVDEG